VLAAASPVALGSVAGAAGATVLVFALGRVQGRLVPEAALLVGVVFNEFSAANGWVPPVAIDEFTPRVRLRSRSLANRFAPEPEDRPISPVCHGDAERHRGSEDRDEGGVGHDRGSPPRETLP
jgi:hypothetical protein